MSPLVRSTSPWTRSIDSCTGPMDSTLKWTQLSNFYNFSYISMILYVIHRLVFLYWLIGWNIDWFIDFDWLIPIFLYYRLSHKIIKSKQVIVDFIDLLMRWFMKFWYLYLPVSKRCLQWVSFDIMTVLRQYVSQFDVNGVVTG